MVFLFSLIWLFLGVIPANAATTKDYSITNVTINNTINTDGSMDVVESRTYNFDGSFSYAYQSINKTNSKLKSYSVKDFTLCDELTCYKSALSTNKTFSPNTFYVEENGSSYYIKWFFKANNQNKTFTLKYKVENVVTLQTDTAEIYWQSIGNETSKSQSNIMVKYFLPNGVDGTQIKAYGHGPLNGIVSIPSSKEVDFSSKKLPLKTYFENRILLPKNVFTGGLIGTKNLSQIIAEEDAFIAKTKAEQDAKKAKDLKFATILFLVLIVQFVFFIKKILDFNRYSKDKKIPKSGLSGRFWEPPSNIDPSQVEQLLTAKDKLTPKSITATILFLISNRFLKMEREENNSIFGKKYKYSLSLVENSSSKISSIEQLTLDLIKEIMGDSTKIYLKDITSWFKTNPTKGRNFLLKDFPQKTTEENVSEGYFDEIAKNRNKKYVSWFSLPILSLSPVLGIFLFMFFGPYSVVIFIANIIIAAIIVSIGKKLNDNYQKRTDKGVEEASKWIGFKKHLKEYNQTVKDPIDSIVIWEKYLIYGSVLGISLKTLSELPINLGPEEQQILINSWSVSDVSNLSNISIFTNSLNSVTSSLNSVSSYSYSSSYGASGSGSSGGFSGGGGSGGGGGGCGAG